MHISAERFGTYFARQLKFDRETPPSSSSLRWASSEFDFASRCCLIILAYLTTEVVVHRHRRRWRRWRRWRRQTIVTAVVRGKVRV